MGKGNVQARFHLLGVTLLLAALLMAFVATADGTLTLPAFFRDTVYGPKRTEDELDKIYEILEEIRKDTELSRIYNKKCVQSGYAHCSGHGTVNVIVGVLAAAVVVLILIICCLCYYLFCKKRASQASQSVRNNPCEFKNFPSPQNNLNI